jgi:hypothetical protein
LIVVERAYRGLPDHLAYLLVVLVLAGLHENKVTRADHKEGAGADGHACERTPLRGHRAPLPAGAYIKLR